MTAKPTGVRLDPAREEASPPQNSTDRSSGYGEPSKVPVIGHWPSAEETAIVHKPTRETDSWEEAVSRLTEKHQRTVRALGDLFQHHLGDFADARGSVPKGVATDGGRPVEPVQDITKECPECGSLDLEVGTRYTCRTCGLWFDKPARRQGGPGRDIAVDELGPRVQQRRSEEPELVTDGGRDISAVFARLSELAIADGDVPDDGSGLDGVWTRTVPARNRDRDWNVALNADTDAERGATDFPREGDTSTLKPGQARIALGGWPAGVLSPFGGTILVEQVEDGPQSLEDELLRDIETELIDVGADIERTIPDQEVTTDGGQVIARQDCVDHDLEEFRREEITSDVTLVIQKCRRCGERESEFVEDGGRR